MKKEYDFIEDKQVFKQNADMYLSKHYGKHIIFRNGEEVKKFTQIRAALEYGDKHFGRGNYSLITAEAQTLMPIHYNRAIKFA